MNHECKIAVFDINIPLIYDYWDYKTMGFSAMNVVVMIPSLNPSRLLLSVVEAIRAEGFQRFLIIDDGSSPKYREIFDELEEQGCTVIRHAVNLGKGRALKTGFNHVMAYMPGVDGVVTCDSDGQHEPQAIRSVAEAMINNPGHIVLGVRKFFEAKVPLTNLFGNTVTRAAFALLTGLSFGDTQCGLRAFPADSLKIMMRVAGERFEYENVMLLDFRRFRLDYTEVPIRAVYETVQQGKLSHFNKLVDPIRIYRKLLGFAVAPIVCGSIASVAFMLAAPALTGVWVPAAAGLAALLGLIILALASPARRAAASATMALAVSALCAGLVWVLTAFAGFPAIGAWWLMAVPVGPLAYALWLRTRYGKKPKRVKVSPK